MKTLDHHPLVDTSTMTTLMTADEIIKITGTKRVSKQIEILVRHGVPHIVDLNGHPQLTWYQFNHAHLMKPSQAWSEEPDFSALDGD